MKITKIQKIGKTPVYDLSVADAEHYILKNGVVTHNTGITYSSDNVWIIGRQQDKDADGIQGYHFIINVEKSRFVKEKSKIPISVSWEGGILKWSGLLDVALEAGWVKNPKQGFYAAYANPDDKEPIGKNVREADTQTAEFWKPILTNPKFNEWIKARYSVGKVQMIQAEEE